jgi:NitT/TauT family transport system ATP-binding protein
MQDLVHTHLRQLRPTTILVTHHRQEAAALADRIITLDGSPACVVDDQPIQQAKAAE